MATGQPSSYFQILNPITNRKIIWFKNDRSSFMTGRNVWNYWYPLEYYLSLSLSTLSLFPPLRGSPTEAGKRLKRERERGEEYDQRVVGWLVGWLAEWERGKLVFIKFSSGKWEEMVRIKINCVLIRIGLQHFDNFNQETIRNLQNCKIALCFKQKLTFLNF